MSLYFFDHLHLLIGMPGGTEWLLILLIVILFFGGKKIPGLMRGLGRSVREFNEARAGDKKDSGSQEGTKVSEKSSANS